MRAVVNILYLITTWVVGGTETQLLYLLRHMDRSRYKPHVCALYGNNGIEERFGRIDVPAFSMDISRMRNPSTLTKMMRLSRYCRKQQIRIIHCVRTDHIAAVLAPLGGVPVVLGGQRNIRPQCSFDSPPVFRSVFRWIERQLDARLTAIIANSSAASLIRSKNSKLDPRSFYVIANGIDLSLYGGGNPGTSRIPDSNTSVNLMIIGRLDACTKGHFTLLEAMSRLNDPSVRLLIVGDGPDAGVIRNYYDRLGLSSQVHMLGNRDDIPGVLTQADIVVAPSLSESSPNVILEAWAARRPVIASNVGGVPEIVENRVNGLLVQPGNPADLASAIRKLTHEPELRALLARNGRSLVEARHTVQKMTEQTTDLYDAMLSVPPEDSTT